MKLALRELVRRPGRFVTATAILTLIALLLMFLGGLLDGLIRNSTGAVRAQDADVIVYSESSQASFLLSLGLLDRLAAVGDPRGRAYIEQASAVQKLVSPSEMGELFKVLALASDDAIAWRGFTLGDRRGRL